MFGVLPNFKTVNDPDQPITPIGPVEKFQLVLHYFDPFTLAVSSVQAGIEQATNEKASYGQGVSGYSKRYGADLTDAFTNELFVVGVFPACCMKILDIFAWAMAADCTVPLMR